VLVVVSKQTADIIHWLLLMWCCPRCHYSPNCSGYW